MNNFFTNKQSQSVTTKLLERRHEAVYNFHMYLNKKIPTARYINKQNYFVLIEWFQQQKWKECQRVSSTKVYKILSLCKKAGRNILQQKITHRYQSCHRSLHTIRHNCKSRVSEVDSTWMMATEVLFQAARLQTVNSLLTSILVRQATNNWQHIDFGSFFAFCLNMENIFAFIYRLNAKRKHNL